MRKGKRLERLRRAKKGRASARRHGDRVRVSVTRSNQHFEGQIYTPDGGQVLAAASTREADIKKSLKHTGNVEAAIKVGKILGERAKEKSIDKGMFDRSGYKYHGCVKAFADALREFVEF